VQQRMVNVLGQVNGFSQTLIRLFVKSEGHQG
jgi:hypothetical protein